MSEPETRNTPSSERGSMAVESMRAIAEKRNVVKKRWWELETARNAAKEAKAEYDGAVSELMATIDEQNFTMPLFDRPVDPDAPPPEPPPVALPVPPPGQDWRKVSLAKLTLTAQTLDNLQDAGLFALGQLYDLVSAGQALTDIGGIGPAKAKVIAEAIAAHFSGPKPKAAPEPSPEPDDDEPPAWEGGQR